MNGPTFKRQCLGDREGMSGTKFPKRGKAAKTSGSGEQMTTSTENATPSGGGPSITHPTTGQLQSNWKEQGRHLEKGQMGRISEKSHLSRDNVNGHSWRDTGKDNKGGRENKTENIGQVKQFTRCLDFSEVCEKHESIRRPRTP